MLLIGAALNFELHVVNLVQQIEPFVQIGDGSGFGCAHERERAQRAH
jgi:hypothetical protein